MTHIPTVIGISCLIAAFTAVCPAQIDPNNVPKPPTAELKKFEPFLGKYNQTMDYAARKWSGTLEIKPAIKGWYVERIILTKTEGIDREFHSMFTYDTTLKRYRIWRFETLPPEKNEGVVRFEGDELIEEYEFAPGGIFRNRTTMVNSGELRIISELQDASGRVRRIGVTTAKRMK
jgi:hypothetical protein